MLHVLNPEAFTVSHLMTTAAGRAQASHQPNPADKQFSAIKHKIK